MALECRCQRGFYAQKQRHAAPQALAVPADSIKLRLAGEAADQQRASRAALRDRLPSAERSVSHSRNVRGRGRGAAEDVIAVRTIL